jgi:serralysin
MPVPPPFEDALAQALVLPAPPVTGDSFVITFDADGSRSSAKVAQLADGRFVSAWTDFETNEIGFRILNADGSVASVNRVASAALEGNNEGVSLTALAGGGFVIAWTNQRGGDDPFNVAYRIYGADGVADTPATLIDRPTGQSVSHVSATATGGFTVSWAEGSTNDGLAQQFDAAGAALGAGPVRLTDGAGFDSGPIVVADTAGYAAVWADGLTGGPVGTGGIFQRSFTTFPTSDETTEGGIVSDDDLSAFGRLNDAALNNGVLGVVWLNGSGQNSAAYLKIGSAAPVLVGSGTADFEDGPQIAGLPNGGFVVTWVEVLNNDPLVYGRLYDAAGQATSDAFLVTAGPGRENTPDVTVMQDGRILFTYDSGETDGYYMRGRFFDPRVDPLFLIGTSGANQYVGTRFAAGDTLAGVGGNDTLWGVG